MSLSRIVFAASLSLTLAMVVGCGGSTQVNDTAEVIRTEPAVKPSPTAAPTPTPPADPSKDAPKG